MSVSLPSIRSSATTRRPHRKRFTATRDQLIAIILVIPSIIAIAIFVYGFIGWSLRVSLSQWTGLLPDYTFVGLRQYVELLADRRFGIDVRNTAIFTALFLTLCLIIGLMLAILLDQRLKGENLFRSIYLFPMAISFIVTGVAWRWLMNSASGSRISGLNLLFQELGLDFLINRWHLTDPPWGIAFIAIPAVWQMSGFTMALYLGGLRSISEDLREAARVDGASELQIYRHVILPLLRPVTLSAIIILGHTSLKIFDLIVAISQNNIALDVPSVYMWRTTFDGNNYGRGAAIGIFMLLTVAVLIIPYMFYTMRKETEV
jgi:glucose/mannose transport system permease protein